MFHARRTLHGSPYPFSLPRKSSVLTGAIYSQLSVGIKLKFFPPRIINARIEAGSRVANRGYCEAEIYEANFRRAIPNIARPHRTRYSFFQPRRPPVPFGNAFYNRPRAVLLLGTFHLCMNIREARRRFGRTSNERVSLSHLPSSLPHSPPYPPS